MKVIKDNSKNKTQPAQINCKNCHSVLEVTPSDVKRSISDRDGNAHVFNCAVCHHDIWVDISVTKW